jgi:multidrug efflux pump subunit AcrB
MVLIVVCIFNSTRATLVICLTVPLAIIGVTAGLLLTGQPFGFMALLGAIALADEQIKNSIVLVDEFQTQRFDLGKPTYEAIVTGSVSRLRPVMLVAVTTVLGMITDFRRAWGRSILRWAVAHGRTEKVGVARGRRDDGHP